MKFIKSSGFFILVFMFLISCMPNHDILKHSFGKKLPENEVNAYVAKMDKKFTSPGFKGLHLGMSHHHVNELVKNTYWSYRLRRLGKKEDDPNYKNEVWMGRKIHSSPVNWTSIGCYGREGNTYCHWVHGVLVKFYNGNVVYIGLNGVMLSANEIDRRVKNWGKFALNGLTEKYGVPTKVYKSIEEIGIFDFKSGYQIPVCSWDLGGNAIKLTIDESSSEFGYSIVFYNKEGLKEVSKEESSGKHAF